ncbi:cadherin-23 [Ixodes scapularis]|uniref:cadherin-23 n=1 Tax=Ixodes scapularis TaxID=6945 RepID=UPI001A9D9FF6|nr:cadherin-23 [Ixodes scapularis]
MWTQAWSRLAALVSLLATACLVTARDGTNTFPRFSLGGISEIVVRIKEGPGSLGQPLYRLRGEDADGDVLSFGAQGPEGPELLRFDRVSATEADVFLRHELDREVKDSHTVVLTLTDGRLPEGQYITQTMLVIVDDVNDNEPVFKQYRTTVTVSEDAAPQVIDTVEAIDRDQGPFGQVIYQLQNTDSETRSTFSVHQDKGKGIISLVGPLDYERKFIYELRILAIDRANSGPRHTATAVVLVKVDDVEDQPPVFTQVPPVTRISEDLPLNSMVLTVKAMDGDRGVNNPISYSILSGGDGLFAIDRETGVVSVKGRLDREATENRNGAFILLVQAQEVSGSARPLGPTARTEVTILLTDVNDEEPTFRSRHYVAEVNENAQLNVPVNFVGDSIAEVYDHDQGSNGTFQLRLEEDNGVFEVTPSIGVNEVSFMIRVKNPDHLDYERVKLVKFKIVAQEMVASQPKTSTADVTVHIKDANDNFPVFREDSYRSVIPENAAAGTVVAVVRAEDADSGVYGTAGIRYTNIRGQIADKLKLDPETGKVVMATSEHGLDRETTPEYLLTVEARDENGRGNRNTVQLHLVLEDVNDNAPGFVLPSYEARIRENAADFRTPFVVRAVDADQAGTENCQVRYQIVRGDPDNNFTIDEAKGRIKPRQPLDFERIAQPRGDVRTFNLVVRAYDLGRPSLSSNVSVVVYVQDVNDHSPVFPSDFVAKSIPEDVQEGTAIVKVLAEDQDHSPSNSKVVYRIQNGAQDKFVIDALTGVISVAPGANLDPDRTFPKSVLYSLQILALDGGLGEQQRSSMVTVNISIVDVNNKAPRFDDPGTVELVENSVPGHTVAIVRATDQDDRPMLRYSLCRASSEARNEDGALVSEFDVQQTFEIHALEGKLMVKNNVDREKMESIKVCVRVEDMAAATPHQTATATLSVKVMDVNDNKPTFKKPFYRQTVTENSVVGAPIVTARAVDADKNHTVTYSLEGKAEYLALINIDRRTGEVTVTGKIDRELYSWINVTLKATDSGLPPLSGVTDLQIQVLDENDNNPIFKYGPSEFSVSEDARVGSSVATVQAVDADVGGYGRVTYALDAAGTDGKFKIDRDSGIITVAMPLNREETASYSLIVQAWDNYEAGFGTDESRRTFKQVSVRVVDVNDESPVFVRPTQCAQVSEFHRAHETVFLASATDGDDPTSPNSKITFTLQSGFDADLFEVETLPDNTARVANRYSLRGRVGNATVALKAQDQGLPPRSSVQRFTVCVSDVNDHSPVFIRPPQNHTIRIPENATLGTVVVEVGAEDGDFGANAEVRYRLKDLPNNHWKTFRLDEITGIITLRLPLDRETQKVYELRVEAFDLGQPTSLSSDLDLTVFVTDVNDYAPEFTEDVHQLTFTENMKPGAESYKLINTIDRDDDLSILKPIPCYYIVGGNERGRFSLDLFTHQLSASEVLDREEESNYTLLVRASDDCFHEPRPVARFDSRDNTLLQVQITVLDVNDNPPRFVSPVFTGGVTMEADFGVVFMAVRAVDLDDGINSLVSYYLVGEIRRTLSEGLESLTGPPFLINHRTGELSLNFYPQRGMKGYFDLTVVANDTQGLQDSARVFIYLLREDQRVRFVLRLTPEEFRDKMEEFREVLANITGAIVNVDEAKVHENEDGSVDRKKSDLYLHFVNREDNSIMEVSTVLTLIDKNIEFLDKLFKEFNVLYSEPADALSDAEREEDQMRTWLIGLSVFLSVMLALVISLCLAQRSRYERQLKAATATAFGSRDSALNRVDVPNTNQHSVEGSNPIWMHSYDNDWYKEDEETRPVDSNSLDENAVAETSGSTSSSSDSHRQSQDREFDSAQLCSEVYVLSNGTVQNISMPVGSTDLLCPEVAERNNLNRYNKNGCPYASVFLGKMGTPNRAGKLEVSEL